MLKEQNKALPFKIAVCLWLRCSSVTENENLTISWCPLKPITVSRKIHICWPLILMRTQPPLVLPQCLWWLQYVCLIWFLKTNPYIFLYKWQLSSEYVTYTKRPKTTSLNANKIAFYRYQCLPSTQFVLQNVSATSLQPHSLPIKQKMFLLYARCTELNGFYEQEENKDSHLLHEKWSFLREDFSSTPAVSIIPPLSALSFPGTEERDAWRDLPAARWHWLTVQNKKSSITHKRSKRKAFWSSTKMHQTSAKWSKTKII